MKKLYTILPLSIGILFGSNAISQNQPHPEQCGFNALVKHNETIAPGYKEQLDRTYFEHVAHANHASAERNSNTTYHVDVVVHVVWNTNTPSQNLADSVIHNQIASLNLDYMRMNADTANLRPEFDIVKGNPNVMFHLATEDTAGNPTTGIIRHETSATFGGGFFPDMAEISKIQKAANDGSSPWDQSKYVNIWIGDINGGGTPSLLGIATPPQGLSNWPANSVPAELEDGIILQYQTVGSNNPNPLNVGGGNINVIGRTLTHEMGHYLGVRHTAEQSFFTPVCDDDDGLNDTPNCEQSGQDCNTTRNSCTDAIGPDSLDLKDMVENYMDYSSEECQNSFTAGQVTIMRSVLDNERTTLVSTSTPTSIYETPITNTNVFPNPNNGQFTIETTANNWNYVLINSLGQTVAKANNLNSTAVQLNITDNGVYILQTEVNGQVSTQKLIVQ